MKIYIATPVNGRKEKTLEEKRQKAHVRVQYIEKCVKERIDDVECHSSFDDDIRYIKGEAKIMGCCVQKVMECDFILMDWGWDGRSTKGCKLERKAAELYGKTIWTAADLNIEPPENSILSSSKRFLPPRWVSYKAKP